MARTRARSVEVMSASGQATDYYRRMNMNESRRARKEGRGEREEQHETEGKRRGDRPSSFCATKREREKRVNHGGTCLLTGSLSDERDGNSDEKSRNERDKDGGRRTGDERGRRQKSRGGAARRDEAKGETRPDRDEKQRRSWPRERTGNGIQLVS